MYIFDPNPTPSDDQEWSGWIPLTWRPAETQDNAVLAGAAAGAAFGGPLGAVVGGVAANTFLKKQVLCKGSPQAIDSPCECEYNNLDSLDARLFPYRGVSCRVCCDHGRSIFSVVEWHYRRAIYPQLHSKRFMHSRLSCRGGVRVRVNPNLTPKRSGHVLTSNTKPPCRTCTPPPAADLQGGSSE